MTEKTLKEKKINKTGMEEIEEPQNLFIKTNPENFILESRQEIDSFMERLKKSQYSEDLYKLYSKYSHEIEDFTQD